MGQIRPENIPDEEVRAWYANKNLVVKKEIFHTWYAYGNGAVIRKYLDWNLPLPLGICHSYSPGNYPLFSDYHNNPFNHFWCYSDFDKSRIKAKFQDSKTLHVLGHPILYEKFVSSSIKRPGSLAVPDHSKNAYILNWNEYLGLLQSIPEHFKPVTICLSDNMLFLKKSCEGSGFQIVSAGEHRGGFYKKILELFSQWEYIHTTYEGSALWIAMLSGSKPFYYGTIKKRWHHNNEEFENSKQFCELFDIENVENGHDHKKKLMEERFGTIVDRRTMLETVKRCSEDSIYQKMLQEMLHG